MAWIPPSPRAVPVATTGAPSSLNITTKTLRSSMKLTSLKTKLRQEVEEVSGLLYDVLLRSENAMFNALFIPAASQPPPKKPATVVRRTSSVTEEDRENALKVRKNALKSNGGMFFHEIPFVYPVMMTPFQRHRPLGHRSLFRRCLRLSPQGERYHVEHFRKSLCATAQFTPWLLI